jgi:hypothetical protein
VGKLRRDGLVFLAWKGDRGPRHVHVYRKGRFVVKWDLENDKAMEGRATRQVVRLIGELRREGKL